MPTTYRIAPSLLSADFSRLGDEVRGRAGRALDPFRRDGQPLCPTCARVAGVPLRTTFRSTSTSGRSRSTDRRILRRLARRSSSTRNPPNTSTARSVIHASGAKAGLAFNPHSRLADARSTSWTVLITVGEPVSAASRSFPTRWKAACGASWSTWRNSAPGGRFFSKSTVALRSTTSRRSRALAQTRSFRAARSSAHRIMPRRSRRCGQPWPCYSRKRELRPQLAQGRVALAAPLLILRVPRRAQTTRATPPLMSG